MDAVAHTYLQLSEMEQLFFYSLKESAVSPEKVVLSI